jgi:ribose 5-phosphate isomerase B
LWYINKPIGNYCKKQYLCSITQKVFLPKSKGAIITIRLAIGADHRGFVLKNFLKEYKNIGHYTIEWHDVGAYTKERSDYPVFACAAAQLVCNKTVDAGIIICATGVGMAVVANRFKGVYAGVAWNEETAALAKQDDNSNMLVLPASFITQQQAHAMVSAWLLAKFKGGRYAQRIALIDTIS